MFLSFRPNQKYISATWALDRGVSVVICNGSQDNAIKTIVGGRKVGTFFTETNSSSTPVEHLAENGKKTFSREETLIRKPIYCSATWESCHAESLTGRASFMCEHFG
jgi:hypothetical protein